MAGMNGICSLQILETRLAIVCLLIRKCSKYMIHGVYSDGTNDLLKPRAKIEYLLKKYSNPMGFFTNTQSRQCWHYCYM